MNLKDKLFNNFNFCDHDSNYWNMWINDKLNLFDIYIENPFRIWWKAKKFFKIPKTKIKFFYKKEQIQFSDILITTNGELVTIDVQDLQWKDKYNSPRFEYSPHIFFSLFGRFGFCIYPEINGINEFGEEENRNLEYWEYLLDYINYNRGLKLNSCWTTYSKIFQQIIKYGNSEDGAEDEKEPYKIPIYTHLFSLNKKGLTIFKRLYEQAANNRNNKKSI